MRVVVATKNKHKIDEIQKITRIFGMEVIGRDEAGVPNIEVEEDEDTFEANSLKKAVSIMGLCKEITIADDSGLMVDALDGAPGVYSARFAGEDGNDEKNNLKLIERLKDVPYEKRTARFVSVIAMAYPDGKTVVARGECTGRIIDIPRGVNGFGYDPLFVPDGYEKTFGELSQEEKNTISHRAKALQELKRILENS